MVSLNILIELIVIVTDDKHLNQELDYAIRK